MDTLFETYKSSPRTAHAKVMEQLRHEHVAGGENPSVLKSTGEQARFETSSDDEEKV